MFRWLRAAGLALACAARSHAACDAILESIRNDISESFRMEVSCRELQAATKTLPVIAVSPAQELWAYAGEQELREDLGKRFGIRFSSSILPVGAVERQSPEGRASVLVFGLEMPRRSWALLALTQQERLPSPEGAAAVLGEGALYDWVGVYPRDAEGRYAPDGQWLRIKSGGGWSAARPAPLAEARACLPCRGWICPAEPLVCFADFNANAREEALLIDDCQSRACTLRLVEDDAKGRYAVLLDEPGVSGRWARRPEGWVLVSEPFCPPGEFCGEGGASLGNPNCERPDVYRFDPAAGRWSADPSLREEYYPVEERPAPWGCEVHDRKGVVVYTSEGRFVRFRPR